MYSCSVCIFSLSFQLRRESSLVSVSSADDNVFPESNESDDVTPIVTEESTTELKTPDNDQVHNSDTGHKVVSLGEGKDQGGLHLDAIQEVDEHSNYGVDADDDNDDVSVNDTDQTKPNKLGSKPVTLVDTKRKLFSRQSSSASLTKNTDSFGDSGIETMDSVNCSEIREQPDVYDVDMPEDRAEDLKNTPYAHDHDSGEIYVENEDDEDMIEARHVRESLSRVSSSESLDKLKELDTEKPNDRVRNFVNEYNTMYVEVEGEPDPEVLVVKKETDTRFERAQTLQKAILKHSSTAPQLTMYRSNVNRPQTARPSIRGPQCSHIDIDLTCEAPPRAAIKSHRHFDDRIKSARMSREMENAARRETQRQLSTKSIDITNGAPENGNSSAVSDWCRWPLRPLTRPRSPVAKRPAHQSDKQINLDLKCVSAENNKQTNKRATYKRSKSANHIERCVSPARSISRSPTRRPQTAHLSYTGSRLENDVKRDVLTSKPFANADELYPNKTVLTSFHHGFRTIWPIGRKINVIQNKRPFEAFEMNSYSRSIERGQCPFKGDHSIKVNSFTPTVVEENVKPLTVNKAGNSLSMDSNILLQRPTVRKVSLYINPNTTPRSVR